jgi:hypothetical protein
MTDIKALVEEARARGSLNEHPSAIRSEPYSGDCFCIGCLFYRLATALQFEHEARLNAEKEMIDARHH